ncbi:MAG: histidine phosphatase family protein [Chloroflexota bacterium]
MIELHLLRHADAGDPATWPGDDADRPLSAKGRRQAARLGNLLAGAGFTPDAIISSPKLRARETAETVATALGVDVRVDDRLGGALDIGTIAGVIKDAGGPRRPVLVGHDPDLSWLASELTGTRIELRKGALARIDVEVPFDGSGTIRWLIPPGLLPDR